jgi:hypothetical protein
MQGDKSLYQGAIGWEQDRSRERRTPLIHPSTRIFPENIFPFSNLLIRRSFRATRAAKIR